MAGLRAQVGRQIGKEMKRTHRTAGGGPRGPGGKTDRKGDENNSYNSWAAGLAALEGRHI